MSFPVTQIIALPKGYEAGIELATQLMGVNPDLTRIMDLFADNATFSIHTISSQKSLNREEFKEKLQNNASMVTAIGEWTDEFRTAKSNKEVFKWKGKGLKSLEGYSHQNMPDGTSYPLSSWFFVVETIKCQFSNVDSTPKIVSCLYKNRRVLRSGIHRNMERELSIFRKAAAHYLKEMPKIRELIDVVADDSHIILSDETVVTKQQYGDLLKEFFYNRTQIGPIKFQYHDDEGPKNFVVIKGYERRADKLTDENGKGWDQISIVLELLEYSGQIMAIKETIPLAKKVILLHHS